jgi:hypothetical protein
MLKRPQRRAPRRPCHIGPSRGIATCYDKIKPTAFDDPDHSDGSRAMYTYTGAEWFACHVDDYSAPNRDDEPMTCTDPSTQAYVERMVQVSKN